LKSENSNSEWLYTISPKGKFIDFNFKEIWRYKDLLFLFVKRDVITLYKQTVLGPLWYLIQPLITSVIFTIIFNGLANINVGTNVHPFLFNLAGVTIWNYFAECLKGTSDSFKKNQNIFSKVYFPRVIMPSAVMYPIKDAVEKIQNNFPKSASYINPLIENNPLAHIVETFRYMFFSQGAFSTKGVFITLVVTICIALLGLVIFNKTEKSFIDTV